MEINARPAMYAWSINTGFPITMEEKQTTTNHELVAMWNLASISEGRRSAEILYFHYDDVIARMHMMGGGVYS